MTPQRVRRLGLLPGLVVILAIIVPGTADATTTRVFRQTTAKDFEEGEATSSAVSPPGEVVPGMKSTRVAIDAAFVWCATLARDGKTGYFGTGDGGLIYAATTAGEGPAKKIAAIDAPWVTALASKPDGGLLAGSTPGARLFSVDAQTGKSKLLAKLPAEHIWALDEDASRGVTYAATGDPGRVYAVDGTGKARMLWDARDKHVMALAREGAALLAGTAGKAILYRVQADGHAEALHDFDADEVRAVVRGKGAVYLAVNAFDSPSDAAQAAPAGPQTAKGTRIVAAAPAAGASTAATPASGAITRSDAVKAHGAVYRLADDGAIEQLFALADGYFTALYLDEQGILFAASGSQGKLYRITPDHAVALIADVPERQVLSLVPAGEGFLLGSGDAGALYRVRPARGDEASYLSKVFDAEAPAKWGQLWWSGSDDLVLATRSGNTGKPDDSWLPFRRVEGTQHGPGESSARITSPSGRYLQYRVILPSKRSILRDVSIYYLPQNQRARVTEISLADSAASAGGASSTRVHAPVLRLRWKVDNPDGDDLIYRLWFRQRGDTLWRPLGGPDPLTRPEYDWNTDSVADGRYVVRVWASDERVTPAERALSDQLDSPPFLVDNTRPEIVGLAARGDKITGRAHDATSVISAIEYAVDGGEWRPASPDDQLLDKRDAPFTVVLPKSVAPGPHIVSVRAWDQADNLGSARIEVRTGAKP